MSLPQCLSFFFFFPTSKIFLITRRGLGLVFIAPAGPWASGLLELPPLGAHVGFGVALRRPRGLAEMPEHLSALVRPREQDDATAFGGVQGQLVEGEDLALGLEDVTPGRAARTSWTCTSSVIVPTATAIFPSCIFRIIQKRDRSGLLMREQPLQHHLVEGGVRCLARNLCSLTHSLR